MKSLKEFLFETLWSHNTNQIIKTIKDIYGDKIINIEKHPGSSPKFNLIYIQFKSRVHFLSLRSKFNNAIDFYGYMITLERLYNGNFEIFVEPKITDSASDLVYNIYKGIIYHITRNKFIDVIENTGLRPRNAEYRKFDKRIFLFSGRDNEEIKSNIDYLIKDMFENNFDDTPIVLKIDVSKTNDIGFYFDSASGNADNITFYTKSNISKDIIEIDKELSNYAKHSMASGNN